MRLGAVGQFAVGWLLAFVIAWKLTHDPRLALAAATLLGAALTVALVAAGRSK